MSKYFLLLFNCVLIFQYSLHAQKITGQVFDATTKTSIPFATIKFGNTDNGMIADLNGNFELLITQSSNAKVSFIEVSCLGYETKQVILNLQKLEIFLQPQDKTLKEIVIKPPFEKMRRIINLAIENKSKNNPDKFNWYQCHVYYKMVVDAQRTDSLKPKSLKDNITLKNFLENQHLLISETYSIRTSKKPQKLQEDILASKLSGFKKSMFTSLVTDVLPFHAYADYLSINSKDYHNPISNGFQKFYKFNLCDEIYQGKDTTWILSFIPKGNNANELKGRVYINSSGYAISYFVATAKDTMLKLTAKLEQQYEQVNKVNNDTKWFPKHLNFVINWEQKVNKKSILYIMKGTSDIDSVTFTENKNFVFDNSHTVRQNKNADLANDSTWGKLRTSTLDEKEIRSYRIMDSMGKYAKLDKKINYFSKILDWKIPIGFLDFDISKLFTYNEYEGVRLGLGIQTNDSLLKHVSVGGYAGYSFTDNQWKYGLFTEIYLDKYNEFKLRVSFSDDVCDPGKINLNPEIDNNYLSSYLLWRVDKVKTYSGSVIKKFGYWNFELDMKREVIIPKYNYIYENDGINYKSYNANEVSLGMRYSFAERSAPFFGTYYSLGSSYPVWYGKISYGNIDSNKLQLNYTQAIAALVWHKHINRIGYEHFLLEAAKSWSNSPLPLSKLFAANGYQYSTSSITDPSFYTFGGMMTVLPYQFYSDQVINLIFCHDFDWKLYKIQFGLSDFSSTPNISLQYNLLYGSMNHPEVEKNVSFSIPNQPYHEFGLLLKNIIRVKYANLCYLSFDFGYFFHLTTSFESVKNGNLVLDAGFTL